MNSPRRRSTATSARNSSGRQFNSPFSVPFLHSLLKCHPVKGVHTKEEYVTLLGRLDRCLPSSALGGTRRWLGGRRHRRNGRQGRLGGWAHRHARPPSSALCVHRGQTRRGQGRRRQCTHRCGSSDFVRCRTNEGGRACLCGIRLHLPCPPALLCPLQIRNAPAGAKGAKLKLRLKYSS